MTHPIERIMTAAGFKCVRCASPIGTCDCWTKCPCGWSFEKGANCRNPIHDEVRKIVWDFDHHRCVDCSFTRTHVVEQILITGPPAQTMLRCSACGNEEGPFAGAPDA